jgi:hypothetical protein
MDHNTLPTPQFELPEPQAKDGQDKVAPLESGQDIARATELRNTEMPAAPAPVSPTQAAQSVAAADPHAGGVAGLIPGLAPQAAAVDDTMQADDGDLIEKAWIDKAKAIVSQTKADPHKQNAEINKVKKDYIQKRYNKNVKLNDE